MYTCQRGFLLLRITREKNCVTDQAQNAFGVCETIVRQQPFVIYNRIANYSVYSLRVLTRCVFIRRNVIVDDQLDEIAWRIEIRSVLLQPLIPKCG